jgi:hypothetical protein
VATGVLDYFPDAIVEVAHVSYVSNTQHNPGQPVHWNRTKSQDESDALMRHMLARGRFDTDGLRHSAKLAWRALALLQKEIERSSKLLVQKGNADADSRVPMPEVPTPRGADRTDAPSTPAVPAVWDLDAYVSSTLCGTSAIQGRRVDAASDVDGASPGAEGQVGGSTERITQQRRHGGLDG